MRIGDGCGRSCAVLLNELSLDDADLSPDDLVARLGIALDVDALHVDERSAFDGDQHVDQTLVGMQFGLGGYLDKGVALIAVEPGDLLQVPLNDRAAEPVARIEILVSFFPILPQAALKCRLFMMHLKQMR